MFWEWLTPLRLQAPRQGMVNDERSEYLDFVTFGVHSFVNRNQRFLSLSIKYVK